MKLRQKVILAAVTAVFSGGVLAAVSAEEAKQLGGPVLTEFGAERAGNKEGTIPAYKAELIKPPAGWDVRKHGYPDPWNEKPLFSITAQNAAQYADKLDAMILLFKKYPNYRMDIYPTHRTAYYPKAVLDNTAKNATACKGADDDLKLDGCYGGILFPIPKTGRQEMWNHELTYSSWAAETDGLQTWVIPPAGTPALQSVLNIYTRWDLFNPATMGAPLKPGQLYYIPRVDFTGPARQVGNKLLLAYSIDTIGIGSRIYSYIPGQRRVKLAPDLAYDTPSPASGGASTMDEQSGYLGALDRYDFKLLGKKEKFIMYNNFVMTDPRACPDSKLVSTKNFPNPDCVRWELHRVWKVEGKLLPGFRHIYPRRVLYWDEDTHGAGSYESYDASGNLYRVGNTVAYPFFDVGGVNSQSSMQMDLITGIWAASGSMGAEGGAWHPAPARDPRFYTPEALAGEGIR